MRTITHSQTNTGSHLHGGSTHSYALHTPTTRHSEHFMHSLLNQTIYDVYTAFGDECATTQRRIVATCYIRIVDVSPSDETDTRIRLM